MTLQRARRLIVCAAAALCLTCGESGSQPTRPVEVIYYVSGATGSLFEVGAIKAANAEHVAFARDRVFQVPYFFVLENAFQFGDVARPICASFRNADDSPAPIVISFFTGLTLQRSIELDPGQCATLPDGIIDCTAPDFDFDNPCPDLRPVVTSPEVRFEICRAPASGNCVTNPPTGPPNVPFNANLGDIRATNVTQCFVAPVSALPCTTPATFFLEDAEETVTGAFLKVAPASPSVVLQAELYVNNDLGAINASSAELVVSGNL